MDSFHSRLVHCSNGEAWGGGEASGHVLVDNSELSASAKEDGGSVRLYGDGDFFFRDGHITADPFTAGTTTPRSLNLVPPPAAGVERYMKKV